MANTADINSPKPSSFKLARVQGTAAPQPDQGPRTTDSGTGTATTGNSTASLPPLFRPAKPETDRGPRTNDSGSGGTATIAGRGTMEQK